MDFDLITYKTTGGIWCWELHRRGSQLANGGCDFGVNSREDASAAARRYAGRLKASEATKQHLKITV